MSDEKKPPARGEDPEFDRVYDEFVTALRTGGWHHESECGCQVRIGRPIMFRSGETVFIGPQGLTRYPQNTMSGAASSAGFAWF